MTQTGRGQRIAQIILWLIVIGDVLAVLVVSWLAAAHQLQGIYRTAFFGVLFSPATLIASLLILGKLFVIPRIRRFDDRYNAALRGDLSAMRPATQQPTPDPMALPLPTAIQLHGRWPNNILVAAVAALMVALGIAPVAGFLVVPWVLDGTFSLTEAATFVLVMSLGIATACFILGLTLGHETITITEHDVSVHRKGGPDQSIRWEDIRLFAIGSDTGGRRNPKSMAYLLAGPGATVSFPYILRLAWDVQSEPTIPFAEYERRMEALLALIAARTGLPLYDLR